MEPLEIGAIVLSVGWVSYMLYLAWSVNKGERRKREDEIVTLSSDRDRNVQPEIQVKLIHAVNGRILEVSTKKPNQHAIGHYDWESEMYIVEEGQLLSQAIASVMLMKGLEA